MPSPAIRIEKGTSWTNPLWESRRPILLRAAQKAFEGLEALAVSYDQPKVGVVNRLTYADGPYVDTGLALNARDFKVGVAARVEDRLRAVRRAAEWSAVMVHETLHCARSEFVDDNNWADYVTTEGLAYVGEHMYARRFCGKQLVSKLIDYDLTPNAKLEAFFNEHHDKPLNDQTALDWYTTKSAHYTIGDGQVFGIQRVQGQLEQGRTLNDLIRLPSEEVLGL